MRFMTNGAETTRSLTEFYFGKRFVARKIVESEKQSRQTGEKQFRFWQNGTGYLTIIL